MIRNFRRSGQEPDLSLLSQGENAYLVLRGVFHVSPPALGGLSIDCKLTFSNNAYLKLTTEWIMLHGELAIGSVVAPHTRKATITFTDNVKGEDVMAGMGDRGIMISGGTLSLHGDQKNARTKLSATANAGATSIHVLSAAGWRVGDEIVLAHIRCGRAWRRGPAHAPRR